MTESVRLFRFKQFSLRDTESAMKISTDAVLLGAIVKENPNKILDIGTGCGIISIMLAYKTKSIIDAIDIDKNSANEANNNIINCGLKSRINVMHISLQDFIKTTNQKYDLIITNPPYFINDLKSKSLIRNISRHSGSLSYEEIIVAVKKLLNVNGNFYLILPVNEFKIFLMLARVNMLYCHRIIEVRPKTSKAVNRIIAEFKLMLQEGGLIKSLITIRNDDNSYNKEYKALTKEYYLEF